MMSIANGCNMKKVFLVFGLPGAGKTTFSQKLKAIIPDAEHINADIVRKTFNDWDFSEEGRLRQANRMRKLADESLASVVILDFVCPKKEYRNIIKADIMFFIDRIEESVYQDTNKLFEKPDASEVVTIK